MVDSLNYCFWPTDMEYEDLTLFLKSNIEKYTLDYILNLSEDDFVKEFKKLFK